MQPGLFEEVEECLRVILRPHLLYRHVGGRAGLLNSPQPEPPGPSSSGAAARSSRWFWTRAQNLLSWSALMSTSALWCSWWSPASDWITSANGDPVGEDMMASGRSGFLSRVSGTSVTMFVKKEGSGQGWLGKTRVKFIQINLNSCAPLRALKNINSLGCSPRSLSAFVSAVSRSQTVRPSSSLRLSPRVLTPRWLYWVSPRQLLQSDTGVPHFALDPLTYRCLLSLSPAADFAEPRPPRHSVFMNNVAEIICCNYSFCIDLLVEVTFNDKYNNYC